MKEEICPDCGGAFEASEEPTHAYLGGSSGCWSAFNQLLAREFQDPEYFSVHRLTVDAYTVQHPGDQTDRRAAQSINVHLTALYLILEQNRDYKTASNAMKEMARKYKTEFQALNPPGTYAMTVKDVLAAKNINEHCRLVKAWAECVWSSWAEHHDVARIWAKRIGL